MNAKRASREQRPFVQQAVWKAGRWFKYNYLKLSREKGGAAKVAAGFSIGLAVEMVTLPTLGAAFLLLFPLVYLFRASLGGALIGFVCGKVIYIPFAFLNAKVGGWIVPASFHAHLSFLPQWTNHMLDMNMKLIAGGMVDGALLGLLVYFPLKWMLQWYTEQRSQRRRMRKEQRLLKHV